MKKVFIHGVLYLAFLLLIFFVFSAIGMFEDYEVYTPNDILYVDRYWFGTEISSETTPMHLSVKMAHNVPLIISCLAEPCEAFEYLSRVDSLQKIY